MNKFVKARLKLVSISAFLIFSGLSLILYLLEDKITFFYNPSKMNQELVGAEVRLGGFVRSGSVEHIAINQIRFIVTDFEKDIFVNYKGAVPQLFRDGQGVIVTGKLEQNGEFLARELLTKHDERYEPPKK
jgi:cytochrome c-type biogenesis protein CcmE